MTTQTKVDREQLVADLAWDYCEKARNGEKVTMKNFLRLCPDEQARVTFKTLVNTDLLLSIAA
ncbi:MAG: hypothetical protein KGS61_18655, partial [Verrucomicrobia bacterium]|nr:hypothetical protein [Verrucomicrobiota bacterium]